MEVIKEAGVMEEVEEVAVEAMELVTKVKAVMEKMIKVAGVMEEEIKVVAPMEEVVKGVVEAMQ